VVPSIRNILALAALAAAVAALAKGDLAFSTGSVIDVGGALAISRL